jgi:putative flippase GtrA
VTDKIGLRLARFFGVGILGLLVSAGLLHRLVDVYHFDNIISKIATLPVIVLLQYNLNRLFSFHKAR